MPEKPVARSRWELTNLANDPFQRIVDLPPVARLARLQGEIGTSDAY
jgi:hypothetical protein